MLDEHDLLNFYFTLIPLHIINMPTKNKIKYLNAMISTEYTSQASGQHFLAQLAVSNQSGAQPRALICLNILTSDLALLASSNRPTSDLHFSIGDANKDPAGPGLAGRCLGNVIPPAWSALGRAEKGEFGSWLQPDKGDDGNWRFF